MIESNLNKIFCNGDSLSPKSHPKTRCRKSSKSMGDLMLNKLGILACIDFIPGQIPVPLVNRVDAIDLPDIAIPFSKALNSRNKDVIVVFYEPDANFARILHNPKRYVEPLRKFSCVIGPDFSQKIGMNPFICYSNSWWNKALTAYFQFQGITIIPNVTWSTPNSYEYSFLGMPKHSVIAINCTGIKGNHAATYLWRKGYEVAIKQLEPNLIIRYGDKMAGENEAISVYYENINLKNLRNGRKRFSC